MLNDAQDTYDTCDNHETQFLSLISKQQERIETEMFFSEFYDMKKQAIENLKPEAKRLQTTQN